MSWWIYRKEMYARCEEFSKSIDSNSGDKNMAENIHEASTSGAQKIRTRTTASTPITSDSLQQFHDDRSAPTRLDVLPTEILEKILQLLPHDDLLATMNTSDRIKDVIKSSIVLQLHLEDKRIALKKASVRLYWFKAVTTNRSLRLHLASMHTFVRYLPELQGHDHTRAVAQSNLHYGHPHLEAKMEYLLFIAAQRVEPLEHHLFVVIALNDNKVKKSLKILSRLVTKRLSLLTTRALKPTIESPTGERSSSSWSATWAWIFGRKGCAALSTSGL